MTYQIYEGTMERLEKKLAVIRRKCEKYGCQFSYQQLGETYQQVEIDGIKQTLRFILVEADGIAKVNDWRFVATLEHTEKGNIISGVSGIEVPERYYTAAPVCEHCKTNRVRKDTYIVCNDVTGEFKQVGKSCLKDFTRGLSAEAVTQYMSFFNELIKGQAPDTSGSYIRYYEVRELLQYAAETVLKFGYVRRNDFGDCTASRARDYYGIENNGSWLGNKERKMRLEEMEGVAFDAHSEEATQLVEQALNWIAEQDEGSNYIHDLKVVTSLEYTTMKRMGLLCSLFPAYDKDLKARRKAETEQSSRYVGEVGSKVNVKMASIKAVTGWETQWGYTRLYKMTDADGNIYVWKTSKYIEQENGTVSGTIKAHNDFNGVQQTELTRCKVA